MIRHLLVCSLAFTPLAAASPHPIAAVIPGAVEFGKRPVGIVTSQDVEISPLRDIPINVTSVSGGTAELVASPQFGPGFAEIDTSATLRVKFIPSARVRYTSTIVLQVGIADSYVDRKQREETAQHRSRLAALDTEDLRFRLQTETEARALFKAVLDARTLLDSLVDEKRRALAELRSGRYCSKCHRPASQIERELKIPFRQHVEDVRSVAQPASPEKIKEKAAEYDAKISTATNDLARALERQNVVEQIARKRKDELAARREVEMVRHRGVVQELADLRSLSQRITIPVAGTGE